MYLADPVIVDGLFAEMDGSLIGGVSSGGVSRNTDSVLVDIRIDVLVVVDVIDQIECAITFNGRDRTPSTAELLEESPWP